MPDLFSPPLDKARHFRYWQRCLRTLLPHQYTSNDSIRMTLGFFVLAAIDFLSTTPPETTENNGTAPPAKQQQQPLLTSSDRRRLRDWVLSCQHPAGGFCGSPTHVLPDHEYAGYDPESGAGGPDVARPGAANIAATSFALLLLALLAEDEFAAGDAFLNVNRIATLRWLRRLQRDDGSFGEVLVELPGSGTGEDGPAIRPLIAGGRDMRYCYLAATIRWILREDVEQGAPGWVEDIDVDGLVGHIRRAQTYDGGVAEGKAHESHAGYGYCAVAALSLLDRPTTGGAQHDSGLIRRGIPDIPALIRFLVSRQFAFLEQEDDDDDAEEDDPETANFAQPSLDKLTIEDNIQHIGFNGRCNKAADTCYCWWVGGALALLGHGASDLLTPAPARQFLLDKTQHIIGGFSKYPSGPPDIYHAYLGLAALATMGDPALNEIDAALCVSVNTVRKIEKARDGLLLAAARAGGANGGGFGKQLLDLGVTMAGQRPEWLTVEGS